MGGTVNKNDALRIGRGIQDIERLTQKNTTGLNRPVRTKTGIPAKITEVGEFGLYSLLEQQINKEGDGFEDKEPVARIWDGTEDELPQAFEINGTADLDTDLIVYIFRQSNDAVALNQWFFDSASNTGGTSTATDKSNTSIKGKIQFRNDIPFSANLQGPFDFEFQAPKQVGSLTDGNRAYGGNEDGVDNFAGIQRHYKWMWYKPSVTEGYLMPGTAAFKQSVSDEVGLQFLNQMWIRMDHRFDGQVNEVHHGLCAVDFFEQGGGEGKFSETPAGGVQGVVWTSATDGGTNTIKCEFDKTGHLRRLDDKYGDEDEYPTDVNIQQSTGTYPTSSSLYDTGIDQESNLVDENNADTDAFNGPVGTLSYTAIGANGTALNIGFTVSTGFSLAAKAENIPFGAPIAGTGGNDDPIFWDLSKHLDGSDVTLTSLLLEKNRSSTATITDVESVQLVTTIETTPVPDNSSFDVKVELQHGIGGTQAQGTEFIRFNANGEYRVVVFLFLKDKADAFDPDDNQTYLLKESAIVVNKTTFSGNTVSFTFDFDPNDSGSDVCARAFLEFFKTLVNPQPLPDQIGFCDISNANDFDEDCQPIVGTAATGILTFAASAYSPESIGSNVTIDTFELRNINPIVVVYKIQKGGDTTDYTGLPSRFGLFTPEGVEVRVSEDGITDDFSTVTLINPTDGQATDGFEITINYMEDGLIADGQGYIGKAFVDGVTNTPDEFTFTSGGGAFPATDFFGDRSEDLPFPWSDFGGASTFQSTSVNTAPFTDRWVNAQTDGSQSIIGGAWAPELNGNSQQRAITLNVPEGPFEISVNLDPDTMPDSLTTGFLEARLFFTAEGNFWSSIVGNFSGVGFGWAFEFQKTGPNSGAMAETKASGVMKLTRDISGDIIMHWNSNTFTGPPSSSAAGVIKLDLINSSSSPTGRCKFSNFEIQVSDHLGTLVDFFSPNLDRWLDTNPIGEAYQIASPATNSLEQIIPANIGLDLIRLENLFAGGTNPNIATSTWKVESNFTDMIFAGSGTETCMIELQNVAFDTMQCGWRDNGTGGQKFFVNINSVEEVAEANVTSSGKATIERGDFTWSDFGGSVGFSEQKSLVAKTGPILNSRWNRTSEEFNFPQSETLINDVYAVTLQSPAVQTERLNLISNLSDFDTDFEISFDTVISNVTVGTPAISGPALFLLVTVGVEQFGVGWAHSGVPDGLGYQTNSGFVNTTTNFTGGSFNFKIKRVGSNVTMLIDNSDITGGGFTRSGSVTDITINITNTGGGGGTQAGFDATITNLITISAGAEYTNNRVLFKNDDAFKFVFDDSNSPVTDIAIETCTTLTTAFNCTYQDIDIQAPTGTQFTFDPSL